MRRVAVAVAVVASSVGERELLADTNRVASLSWVALPGAEGCAGTPLLASQVEERLHRHALVSPAQADVSIEGRVEPTNDSTGWHAVLELRDRDGTLLGSRTLDGSGPSCTDLRESVALAVALMIDPDAALHTRMTPTPSPPAGAPLPAAPLGSAAPKTDSSQQIQAQPESSSPIEPRVTERVRLEVDGIVGFGVLPATAVGFRAGVMVKPRHFWNVEIYAGAWGSQTAATLDGTSTYFAWAFGGLAACPVALPAGAVVELFACAGTEIGSLGAASSGFPSSHAGSYWTSDAVGSIRGVVPLVARMALEARAEGGLAVVRNAFIYMDSNGTPQTVFDRPLLNGRLALGLAVDVP